MVVLDECRLKHVASKKEYDLMYWIVPERNLGEVRRLMCYAGVGIPRNRIDILFKAQLALCRACG